MTRPSLLGSLQWNRSQLLQQNLAGINEYDLGLGPSPSSHSECSGLTIEGSQNALAWAIAQWKSDLQKAARRGGEGETRECDAIHSGASFISGEESHAPQSIRSQGRRTDLEIDKTKTRWLR